MIAKAEAKYIRVSPRKVRLVIDLIRGKSISRALNILFNVNKGARHSVEKVLKSALSNAESKAPSGKTEDFYISKITADEGPMLKRYRAAAMGRATMIRKRTTHIRVELDTTSLKSAPLTGKGLLSKKRKTKNNGTKGTSI